VAQISTESPGERHAVEVESLQMPQTGNPVETFCEEFLLVIDEQQVQLRVLLSVLNFL